MTLRDKFCTLAGDMCVAAIACGARAFMGFVERADPELFVQRAEAMILEGAGHL